MRFRSWIYSLLRRRHIITVCISIICYCSCFAQWAIFTSKEIGVSKIDDAGMMSRIVWTKSKVAVMMSAKTASIHVFVTDASKSEVYHDLIFLKKAETSETNIHSFHAINRKGDNCVLILTRNKLNGKEEQLRIYMTDRVYIYNFG